jgi:serine O-acetyltransferase
VLNHADLASALSFLLASKLDTKVLPAMLIREVCDEALAADASIIASVVADIHACYDRDPACDLYSMPLLYFKGFVALQTHRIAHWLWLQGREGLALFFQNRNSCVFSVDIHPAAQIGSGIMIDHATGLVIGETTIVGNNVSMLHSVTLGGSGCQEGSRHPHICDGVMISTGAKILGNIQIGEGAKIAAGSVVLESVPPHTTVAGVPARIVGKPHVESPALEMNQQLN